MIILTLPNGIKDPNGNWTKEVEIDSMDGMDEDILADATRKSDGTGDLEVSSSERITRILSRCTNRIGTVTRPKDRYEMPNYFLPAWSSAYGNDRGYAMIRLRQISLLNGDIYRSTVSCSSCRRELKGVVVDLSKLVVTSIPLEVASKDLHEVKLPVGGDVVEWRFIQAPDEDVMTEIMKTDKKHLLTRILNLRVVKVNGKKPTGFYVERLNSADRQFLRDTFDATEGGIDTTMQITCGGCGVEFTQGINVGDRSFFFPSAQPSPSKAQSPRLGTDGGGVPTLPSGSPSSDAPT